jgi:glycine/serine hydroxymethyltransferase
MGPDEFATVAALMSRALRQRGDDAVLAAVREEVAALCGRFDPYAAFTR